MALPQEIRSLIGLPYNFLSSPTSSSPENKTSFDCRLLWQEYYRRRFGVTLPPGLWSEEAFNDNDLFCFVQPEKRPEERPIEGDTYFFGQPNHSPKQLHLAVFIGDWQNHQPLLIHASAYNGRQVKIEPLDLILKTPQYRQLYGIKRLQPELFRAHILPLVYNSPK